MKSSVRTRCLFVLGGALVLVGGALHPDGSMTEMLGHPDWVLSHVLLLGGFVAFLGGLVSFRREGDLTEATRRWSRLALFGTALQVIEMTLHTAAVLDQHRLLAGRETPVLTAHLAATVLFYPVFSATVAGFIVTAARDGSLGSTWISWLGVSGLFAYGLAAILFVALGIEGSRVLFPWIMLFALWAVLAAFWPSRGRAR